MFAATLVSQHLDCLAATAGSLGFLSAQDEDPYVKKTAAVCVAKLHS